MTDQYEKAYPANRIAESLGERDLTWLARETGIPLSTLSDYGRGKKPRVDKAIAIARALSVNVEWLFGDARDPTPAPEAGSQQEAEEQELLGMFRLIGGRERRHIMETMDFILTIGTLQPLDPNEEGQRALQSPSTEEPE